MRLIPRHFLSGLLALSLICAAGVPAAAQLSVSVKLADGQTLPVTARNAARGDEALVLYDAAFGDATHTNAFGVEASAAPTGNPGQYRIESVTSVWECQKKNDMTACGNAPIPSGGIVLSATGSKRDILKNLKPGDLVSVDNQYFQESVSRISVINPTPLNNPGGSGFPGFRASNQLIVYDAAYGKPTTGTNEFGFEVTVRDGVVVEQEGSDSTIPMTSGYVLSGHGNARSWLIGHAPIGAKIAISPDGKQLTSTIDFTTYQTQFERQWQDSPCDRMLSDASCQAIRRQYEQGQAALDPGTGLAAIQQAQEALSHRTWESIRPFPADTVKGVWIRPTDTTREAIGKTLDSIKAAGLNSIFLETYYHGDLIFPSETFAEYGLPRANPALKGVDLLQLWTEEAHKRKLMVNVWFQTFYAGTKAANPPGAILSKYPQWANVQYAALKPTAFCKAIPVDMITPPANGALPTDAVSDCPSGQPPLLEAPGKPTPSNVETGSYFLDPANTEVQTFLLKLSREIVTRYPVDGFQFDYIRYPASFPSDRFSYQKTTWGYTDVARAEMRKRYNFDPAYLNPKNDQDAAQLHIWNLFKVEQVTRFVETASDTLRRDRPKLLISAAVFPNPEDSYNLKHQDWTTWARNGYVDFLAPMTLTSAVKVVESDTRKMVTATNRKVPVFSGIFGPFNNNTADHVITQLEAARGGGASGFVLFDYAHLTPRMREALHVSQYIAPPKPVQAPPVNPNPVLAPRKKKGFFKH